MKFLLAPISMCVCLQCGAQAAAPTPGGVAAPSPVTAATTAPAVVTAPHNTLPPAPSAAASEPRVAGEPEVRHIVIEDDSTRIEELRVRGVPRRIVVRSKVAGGTTYEIITGDGSRDLSDGANTSRGAAGKRVWRVLNF